MRPPSARSRSWPRSNKTELTDDDMRPTPMRRCASARRAGPPRPLAVAAPKPAPLDRHRAGSARRDLRRCSSTRSTMRKIRSRDAAPTASCGRIRATLNREGNALARRRAADGYLARNVGVPQDARRLARPRAAAGRDGAGRGLCGIRRLGARRQAMLVAREASGDGKYKRRSSSCCASTRSPPSARRPIRALLGAFQRWQDPAWKRQTLSLR